MGAVQGHAEAMPTSWSVKVDGGPDLLQCNDSTGEVHDPCVLLFFLTQTANVRLFAIILTDIVLMDEI